MKTMWILRESLGAQVLRLIRAQLQKAEEHLYEAGVFTDFLLLILICSRSGVFCNDRPSSRPFCTCLQAFLPEELRSVKGGWGGLKFHLP